MSNRTATIYTALTLVLDLTVQVTAAPQLADAGGVYAFSESGSTIRFAIGQIDGGGLQGRFGNFSGSIQIDPNDVAHSKVSIVIVPASVSTGQQRIDAFLKSNAVFDAANEKQIVFRSNSVQRVGQDGAVVKGRLTARGKSASETFNVALESFSKGTATFHVTGKVFRSRYGMDVGTPIYSNVVDFDMRFVARRR
jgi:polyisoprenoid-binding protein YceI